MKIHARKILSNNLKINSIPMRKPFASSFSKEQTQFKDNCVCGGNCPRCNGKYSLSYSNDRYEGEAADKAHEGNPVKQRKPKKKRVTSKVSIIENARRKAIHRLSIAYLRINGTRPGFSKDEELLTVRGLISPKIVNLEQIAEILSRMLSVISNGNIVIGPEINECSQWVAYVKGNRIPIHLCKRFFQKSEEEQIRTLIHEAAHAVGIGMPGSETYFVIFDCSPGTADNWHSADAWARYVHCISGSKPD